MSFLSFGSIPWDVAGCFLQDFLPRLLEALKGASAETETCQDVCLSRSMQLSKLSCLFFEISIATLVARWKDGNKKGFLNTWNSSIVFGNRWQKTQFPHFSLVEFFATTQLSQFKAPGGFMGQNFVRWGHLGGEDLRVGGGRCWRPGGSIWNSSWP